MSSQQTIIKDDKPPSVTKVSNSGQTVTTQIVKTGNHYWGNGQINGAPLRMMVDTGASFVSIGREAAIQAGISFQGRPMKMQTANGTVSGILTNAKTINFAGHELKNVPVVVQVEGKPFPGVLLGMSFLGSFDINMNGSVMSLTRK